MRKVTWMKKVTLWKDSSYEHFVIELIQVSRELVRRQAKGYESMPNYELTSRLSHKPAKGKKTRKSNLLLLGDVKEWTRSLSESSKTSLSAIGRSRYNV